MKTNNQSQDIKHNWILGYNKKYWWCQYHDREKKYLEKCYCDKLNWKSNCIWCQIRENEREYQRRKESFEYNYTKLIELKKKNGFRYPHYAKYL